jgi:hypothetical protein
VPVRFNIRKSKGTLTNNALLKNNYRNRGKGNSYSRPVGPNRKDFNVIRKHRKQRDEMRRRATKLKRMRTPPKKGGKLPKVIPNYRR